MPRLVIKQGPGVGRDHALGAGECVVGRDPGVTFVLEDHLASRQHFRIRAEGGAWILEDLGSTNGTRLNGRRVERAVLADGDLVRAGQTELTFVQKDLLGGGSAQAQRAGPAHPPAPVRRRRKLR